MKYLTLLVQDLWSRSFLCRTELAIVFALAVNSGCSKPKTPALQSDATNDAVAIVGEDPITTAQFSVEAARRHVGDNAEAKKRLLDEMIHTRILGQEARQRGYELDPQIVVAVDNILADRLRQEIRSQAKVGTREIEAYYKAHLTEFMTPTAIRSAVIFVALPAQASAEARAERRLTMDTIRHQAIGLPPNTAGFGQLAAQYSDDQETKLHAGDMGFFVDGHTNTRWEKPVIDAAFALTSPNQISDVITTERGYYLVKLIARRDASLRPLDLVRSQFEKQLIDEKERQLTAEIMKSASDQQSIKVFEDRLATVQLQEPTIPQATGVPPPSPGK